MSKKNCLDSTISWGSRRAAVQEYTGRSQGLRLQISTSPIQLQTVPNYALSDSFWSFWLFLIFLIFLSQFWISSTFLNFLISDFASLDPSISFSCFSFCLPFALSSFIFGLLWIQPWRLGFGAFWLCTSWMAEALYCTERFGCWSHVRPCTGTGGTKATKIKESYWHWHFSVNIFKFSWKIVAGNMLKRVYQFTSWTYST